LSLSHQGRGNIERGGYLFVFRFFYFCFEAKVVIFVAVIRFSIYVKPSFNGDYSFLEL